MKPPLTINTIDKIRSASRTMVRELGFMQNELAESSLSPSAVHTIIEVGNGTASNASAVASLLRLEKSSVSRMLKGLAQKGLIKIEVSSSDARYSTLKLTEEGWSKFREIEDYARGQLQGTLGQASSKTIDSIAKGLAAYASALRSPANGREPPNTTSKPQVVFRSGYQSSLLGYVTIMHASFYSKNYGFGPAFECKVATEMADFLGRIDSPKNGVFSAYVNEKLAGSVSIDGEDLGANVAHLRWFIVDDCVRGLGVGKELISRAMEFVEQCDFSGTHLWTFRGLDAARHLYEKAGFKLVEEKEGDQWGKDVMEQMFVRQKIS